MSASDSTSALRSFLINLIFTDDSLMDWVSSSLVTLSCKLRVLVFFGLSYGWKLASKALLFTAAVNGLKELYANERLFSNCGENNLYSVIGKGLIALTCALFLTLTVSIIEFIIQFELHVSGVAALSTS